jgi:DNA-binding NarL/FixJ family response regulator
MKRVVILLGHELFGQGVDSLLSRETGFEIVGRETDANKIIERIRALRPDVVVVDSADLERHPVAGLMRILTEGMGVKVVALNLQANSVCVYRGELREVHEVRDLVDAIEQPIAA